MTDTDIEAGQSLDMTIENDLGLSAQMKTIVAGSKNALDEDRRHFIKRLDRVVDNRNVLLNWMRRNFTEGIDYGRIRICSPDAKTNAFRCSKGNRCDVDWHYSKPSLWKAGAEKLLALLGITPRYPGAATLEANVIQTGRAPQDVLLRCYGVDKNGNVIGEGLGARSVKTDGSLNKAIKMCKKSGMIDMTLSLCVLSEIFSQDIGDDELTHTTPDALEKAEVCTVGPYTGQPWTKIPDDHLHILQEHVDVDDDLKRIATDELERRRDSGEHVDEPPELEAEPMPENIPADKIPQALQNSRTLESLQQTWMSIPDHLRERHRELYRRRREELKP